jgi:adenine nucleotide transporter 17
MTTDGSFVHALAGSVGGAAAMALTYPLEQIRTLQQAEKKVDAVVKEEGVVALYQGCAAVLETVAISNFFYFYTAQYVRRTLEERLPLSPVISTLTTSTIAAATNVVLTEPLWKANTILKTMKSGEAQNQNLLSVILSEAYKNGPASLWSGTKVSLWLVSNPVIQFSLYEAFKKGRKNISGLHAFILGALSKAIATLLTYPLQVAQTRLRIEKNQRTMLAVLLAIHLDKGFPGLFQGCSAKLAQTVLTAAFMFAFYEKILALLLKSMKRKRLS